MNCRKFCGCNTVNFNNKSLVPTIPIQLIINLRFRLVFRAWVFVIEILGMTQFSHPILLAILTKFSRGCYAKEVWAIKWRFS